MKPSILRVIATFLSIALFAEPQTAQAFIHSKSLETRSIPSAVFATQTLQERGIPYQRGLYWFWTGSLATLCATGAESSPAAPIVLTAALALSLREIRTPFLGLVNWALMRGLITFSNSVRNERILSLFPPHWRISGFQRIYRAALKYPSVDLYDAMVRILDADPAVRTWARQVTDEKARRVLSHIMSRPTWFANLNETMADMDKKDHIPEPSRYHRRLWFNPQSESWMLETLYSSPGLFFHFPARVAYTRVRYSLGYKAPKIRYSYTDPSFRGRKFYPHSVQFLIQDADRVWETISELKTLRRLFDAIPNELRTSHIPNAETAESLLSANGLRGRELETHLSDQLLVAVHDAVLHSKTNEWYREVLKDTPQGKPLFESGFLDLSLTADPNSKALELYARRRENGAIQQSETPEDQKVLFDLVAQSHRLTDHEAAGLRTFIAHFEERFGQLPERGLLDEFIEAVMAQRLEPSGEAFLASIVPGFNDRTDHKAAWRAFASYNLIAEMQRRMAVPDLHDFPLIQSSGYSPITLYWARQLVERDGFSERAVMHLLDQLGRIHKELSPIIEPLLEPENHYASPLQDAPRLDKLREKSLIYTEKISKTLQSFVRDQRGRDFSISLPLATALTGLAIIRENSEMHQMLVDTAFHQRITTELEGLRFLHRLSMTPHSSRARARLKGGLFKRYGKRLEFTYSERTLHENLLLGELFAGFPQFDPFKSEHIVRGSAEPEGSKRSPFQAFSVLNSALLRLAPLALLDLSSERILSHPWQTAFGISAVMFANGISTLIRYRDLGHTKPDRAFGFLAALSLYVPVFMAGGFLWPAHPWIAGFVLSAAAEIFVDEQFADTSAHPRELPDYSVSRRAGESPREHRDRLERTPRSDRDGDIAGLAQDGQDDQMHDYLHYAGDVSFESLRTLLYSRRFMDVLAEIGMERDKIDEKIDLAGTVKEVIDRLFETPPHEQRFWFERSVSRKLLVDALNAAADGKRVTGISRQTAETLGDPSRFPKNSLPLAIEESGLETLPPIVPHYDPAATEYYLVKETVKGKETIHIRPVLPKNGGTDVQKRDKVNEVKAQLAARGRRGQTHKLGALLIGSLTALVGGAWTQADPQASFVEESLQAIRSLSQWIASPEVWPIAFIVGFVVLFTTYLSRSEARRLTGYFDIDPRWQPLHDALIYKGSPAIEKAIGPHILGKRVMALGPHMYRLSRLLIDLRLAVANAHRYDNPFLRVKAVEGLESYLEEYPERIPRPFYDFVAEGDASWLENLSDPYTKEMKIRVRQLFSLDPPARVPTNDSGPDVIALEEEGSGSERARSFWRSPSEKPRVLIVNDDPNTRLGLSNLYEGFGYETVVASSGEEALKTLQAAPPVDLIVTDLNMPPGMDGIQFIKELRQRSAVMNQVVPPIFIESISRAAPDVARRLGVHYLDPWAPGSHETALKRALSEWQGPRTPGTTSIVLVIAAAFANGAWTPHASTLSVFVEAFYRLLDSPFIIGMLFAAYLMAGIAGAEFIVARLTHRFPRIKPFVTSKISPDAEKALLLDLQVYFKPYGKVAGGVFAISMGAAIGALFAFSLSSKIGVTNTSALAGILALLLIRKALRHFSPARATKKNDRTTLDQAA